MNKQLCITGFRLTVLSLILLLITTEAPSFLKATDELSDGDEIKFNVWFVEADYVLSLWLLPGFRYEVIDTENESL